MKYRKLLFAAIMASFSLVQVRADNMATIAITPATGVVTLVPRWSIGGNLAGFHHMAQDLNLTGGAANNLYSIKNGPIPAGGDILAFNLYTAASGAANPHTDIGSKLTPNSYSALSSADPDVGYGSVNFYLIHHRGTTDYFTVIKPGSATASAVTDLKPMSGPGGPGTVTGVSGYFGLSFAAANLGYGLNLFYYLRTDPSTGFTKFGTLDPALLGTSADRFDLGMGGHNALAFTGADVGFGTDKMYYLRLDPVTAFTILGTLNPVTGRASDIANLGSVYSTLTFVPGDLGFGPGRFYTTGAVNPTWQSVSFAAIADRAISAGSFTVSPSASSGLPVALTVVPGSTGAASITGPVGGVFTVTPTAPGIVTLQATQAGQAGLFEFNMLRQSFTATGVGTLVITNSPLSAGATVGTPFNFTITASGSPTSFSASPLPAGLAINTSTGAITGSPTTVGTTSVLLGASNSTGSANATLTITVAAAGVSPVITNNPLTAVGTVGTPFSFTITASGTPTSYSASPLPAGLTINSSSGAITGNPTTAATTSVLLGATNASGTGNATLNITVAAAGVPPIITSSPPSGAGPTGTVGTPFSYVITASGLPVSYSAGPLPAGLSLNATTGAITGTPTGSGTFVVTIGATNASGTTTAVVTMTIAPAPAVPSSRIVNFSARALSGPGNESLIMGFVVAGDGKNLLVRGIGPGLTSYGVVNALVDPMLTLFGPGGVSIATNDDWQTTAAGQASGTLVADTAARVGAFALSNGSKDAALLSVFMHGAHTTTMVRPNSTTGVALTEIYDTDVVGTSRLVNVSARMNVTAGEGALIAGFVIAGNAPKAVLIRATGPALTAFAVTNVLADPQIAVFSGSTQIAGNDNWSTGPSPVAQITAASAQVGAFALPAGSRDAALLLTLQPGNYTVQVTGVANTTGVALVEIYDTQ